MKEPAAVGVPEMIPLVRLKPSGSEEPATAAQVDVYGAVPPEAVNVKPLPFGPYATETAPLGGAPELTVRGAA